MTTPIDNLDLDHRFKVATAATLKPPASWPNPVIPAEVRALEADGWRFDANANGMYAQHPNGYRVEVEYAGMDAECRDFSQGIFGSMQIAPLYYLSVTELKRATSPDDVDTFTVHMLERVSSLHGIPWNTLGNTIRLFDSSRT